MLQGQQFVVDNIQYVFEIDSRLSSHPIVQTVDTPDEITAMFDSISYNKVCKYYFILSTKSLHLSLTV